MKTRDRNNVDLTIVIGFSMTFIQFFTVWETEMFDWGFPDFCEKFSYEKFVHSWYAFFDLLDVEESDGFTCEKCGPYPDLVVCDGTSLGFRRQLLQSIIDNDKHLAQVAIKRFR